MLLCMVFPSRLPSFVHICFLQEGMLEGVSRRPFGCSSGSYNVRASELARHRALRTLRVQVILLDDSTQVFEIEKQAKGQALLDLVFNHLELIERDFFGLQYIEGCSNSDSPRQRWLDPRKTVKKQLRIRTKTLGTCGLPVLYFRVKFWVSDPGKLAEEYTRYHVFLQLRRDVMEGRLLAQPSTAALLASYALQSELGDYSTEEHGKTYLAGMRLVPGQNDELEKKIIELHKLHKGQTPADAEFNFLDHAKRLDMYGVDLHKAKDSTNREIHLGVTSIGLVVLQNGIKMNTFSWAKIVKISFKRKQFFIQLRREVTDQTESKPDPSSFLQIVKKKLYKKSENYDSVLGFNLGSYRACKCLWKSCVEHHTFFRLHTPRTPARKSLLTLGSKFRYSGRTEFQAVEDCKRKARVERTFVRSPSKRLSRQTVPTPSDLGRKARSGSGSSLRPRTDSSGYKVTSLQGTKTPKMAWGDSELAQDEAVLADDGADRVAVGVSDEGVGVVRPLAPPPIPPSSASSSSSASSAESDVGASPSPDHQPGGSEESAHGLVTIKMKPDEGGKFGFNVKGGADQNLPVLVSRVAPNTPADRCYPRLNEGDQVLLINGRDVSAMTHEQVVNFIRASRECHSGELVLTVKQNEPLLSGNVLLHSMRSSLYGTSDANPPYSHTAVRMLETEVMSHYGLPPSIVPDHIETIDLDIFNFHTMEKEAGIVPQQPRQDKSPDLRAEGVAKYAPPLEDVPDLLQDHLDALKLLHTRREKGELQLRDILVSGGFPGVDKDFITKAEETLLQDFFVENTEQKDNVSQCSQDTDGRSTRQPPRECRCQQEERKDGEQKTSVSVSVPCNGQDHQINVSVSHGTAKAERQEGQLLQKTHECRCGASAEAGKEISVKVEVNEGKHHVDLAEGSQAIEHKDPAMGKQDVSQEEDKVRLTLDFLVSKGQHCEVNTLVRSSGKAKMTQETNISVTSAVTSQHTSDPLKRQDLGKETKEPLQHEQHLHAPEAPGSVELVEKKHKLGIVKKLLHHKQRMFSQVVPRYEADRRLSRLEEIFFSKDSVLGQKKTRDPNTWKKKLRRVCAVYVPDDLEEPPFQYIPEVLSASATIKGGVPPLQESLMLLAEGLEAGSLVAQFEQLYRRKPGLTVTEARRQDNEKKNRYRDISPYDTTRVILTSTASGDYINASYVNMEVQGSGIINRYIASQGPLAGTCTDFWHMVWEQQSTLIVMLTTVVEQGRVKCHRYWPRLYETVDFGILQVTCNKEEETPGFAFREFTLINTETQEERHITHMQYLAWPDHGVPDDSTEFLNFVTQVRKARVGMVEPTIVHCSAGIGRTGVLILMETAQCLIEANEPIYPLDIVKAMRDQRAMMIQTASQFRFVCEAIHRVYTEELVKPLAEYQQR